MNAWTAKAAGDRLINEHEEDPGNEELYIVTRGRATFELDGERREANEGTFIFAAPNVKRTAFAEEAGTTVWQSAQRPERRTSTWDGSCRTRCGSSMRRATTRKWCRSCARSSPKRHNTGCCSPNHAATRLRFSGNGSNQLSPTGQRDNLKVAAESPKGRDAHARTTGP